MLVRKHTLIALFLSQKGWKNFEEVIELIKDGSIVDYTYDAKEAQISKSK